MRHTRGRTAALVAAGVLVAAALLAWVGPGDLLEAARRVTAPDLALASGLYALFFVLRGLRWRWLLRDVAPTASLRTTSALTAGSWLVNSFVPLKAGDAARAGLLARRERAELTRVLGSVVVERALDVAALAMVASGGLLLLHLVDPRGLPPVVGEAVAVAWVLPVVGLGFLALLPRWLPEERGGFLARLARDLAATAATLRRRPRELAWILPLSLLLTLVQAAVLAVLVRALLPGIPLATLAVAMPLFLLSFAIQVTPGNVGTYEGALVAVLTVLGVGGSDLLASAVVLHILTTGIVTILGSGAILLLGVRADAFLRNRERGEVRG